MDNVVIIEDRSVEKKLSKTAEQLQRKYARQRSAEERILAPKKWYRKLLSGIFTGVVVLAIIFCCLISVSAIVSRVKNTVPTFAGYSVLKVASGSMRDSGFDIGDTVVTKKVKPNTLKAGDIIAFYVYEQDYEQFYSISKHLVEPTEKTASDITLASLFGFQSKDLTQAANAGATLVFHQIVRVFEDESGTRWFKTKGTSNSSEDIWVTSERMVVGTYTDSKLATLIADFLTFVLTKTIYLLCFILVPILLLIFIMSFDLIRVLALSKLELDVVEEKRKLTDEICVKNNVGFNMDTKTKFKVLAQAEPDEQLDYLALLWRGGSAPKNIRKYLIRKNLLISYNYELLSLNRECEKQYREGVSIKNIAKFYDSQKLQIEEKHKNLKHKLKAISKPAESPKS